MPIYVGIEIFNQNKIIYSTLQNAFGFLLTYIILFCTYISFDQQSSVLEISNADTQFFVTWSGQQCKGQGTSLLNGLLADKQKLRNDDEVRTNYGTDVYDIMCYRVHLYLRFDRTEFSGNFSVINV